MVNFLISFFTLLFGLIVGSFLNCVIYRLETGESFLKGRSHCPHCKHVLGWKDLIPILSFIILKGKCRYCGKKISFQYPIVELATGILAFLFFKPLILNPTISNLQSAIYNFLISCFLIVIFFFDLKHYIIPDKVIYPAIFVSGIWYFVFGIFLNFYPKSEIRYTLYSAIGASLFFLFIYLISKGKWLGFGDVKLAILMGIFLGFPKILVALFFSFFIGAIIGIGLILTKKKTLKSEVPFAPFLVLGTFIALFFGEKIISWYLNFFLLK
jgi:prepilin signal peptidase PulO-like enzyme (type II secretory pathway)